MSAYRATAFVTYRSNLSTRATITRMVKGALRTPIMRIDKSTMQRKNSRRRRLQHPLFVEAGSSLLNPLLVQTIMASLMSLMSLTNLVLRQAQRSGTDSRLGGDPCWPSPPPLGMILTCLF